MHQSSPYLCLHVMLSLCVLYFRLLLVYYKRIQLKNSQIQEMHRARYVGRNAEIPCPLWAGLSLFQHLHDQAGSSRVKFLVQVILFFS